MRYDVCACCGKRAPRGSLKTYPAHMFKGLGSENGHNVCPDCEERGKTYAPNAKEGINAVHGYTIRYTLETLNAGIAYRNREYGLTQSGNSYRSKWHGSASGILEELKSLWEFGDVQSLTVTIRSDEISESDRELLSVLETELALNGEPVSFEMGTDNGMGTVTYTTTGIKGWNLQKLVRRCLKQFRHNFQEGNFQKGRQNVVNNTAKFLADPDEYRAT